MDWCTYGSLTVKYFHRFLPPCCANKIPADGKDFRLLMAAADLWFPELDGYEVSVAIFKINIPGRSALFWEECNDVVTIPWLLSRCRISLIFNAALSSYTWSEISVFCLLDCNLTHP